MAGNINSAYAWAVSTCNDPNVGYSQAYRNQQTTTVRRLYGTRSKQVDSRSETDGLS